MVFNNLIFPIFMLLYWRSPLLGSSKHSFFNWNTVIISRQRYWPLVVSYIFSIVTFWISGAIRFKGSAVDTNGPIVFMIVFISTLVIVPAELFFHKAIYIILIGLHKIFFIIFVVKLTVRIQFLIFQRREGPGVFFLKLQMLFNVLVLIDLCTLTSKVISILRFFWCFTISFAIISVLLISFWSFALTLLHYIIIIFKKLIQIIWNVLHDKFIDFISILVFFLIV